MEAELDKNFADGEDENINRGSQKDGASSASSATSPQSPPPPPSPESRRFDVDEPSNIRVRLRWTLWQTLRAVVIIFVFLIVNTVMIGYSVYKFMDKIMMGLYSITMRIYKKTRMFLRRRRRGVGGGGGAKTGAESGNAGQTAGNEVEIGDKDSEERIFSRNVSIGGDGAEQEGEEEDEERRARRKSKGGADGGGKEQEEEARDDEDDEDDFIAGLLEHLGEETTHAYTSNLLLTSGTSKLRAKSGSTNQLTVSPLGSSFSRSSKGINVSYDPKRTVLSLMDESIDLDAYRKARKDRMTQDSTLRAPSERLSSPRNVFKPATLGLTSFTPVFDERTMDLEEEEEQEQELRDAIPAASDVDRSEIAASSPSRGASFSVSTSPNASAIASGVPSSKTSLTNPLTVKKSSSRRLKFHDALAPPEGVDAATGAAAAVSASPSARASASPVETKKESYAEDFREKRSKMSGTPAIDGKKSAENEGTKSASSRNPLDAVNIGEKASFAHARQSRHSAASFSPGNLTTVTGVPSAGGRLSSTIFGKKASRRRLSSGSAIPENGSLDEAAETDLVRSIAASFSVAEKGASTMKTTTATTTTTSDVATIREDGGGESALSKEDTRNSGQSTMTTTMTTTADAAEVDSKTKPPLPAMKPQPVRQPRPPNSAMAMFLEKPERCRRSRINFLVGQDDEMEEEEDEVCGGRFAAGS